MRKFLFLLIFSSCSTPPAFSETSIFPYGSSWKYSDNGSNQGTAWRAPSFDDASWATGTGQFGYGDGDEATLLSFGPDGNNKYITTYFRKSFTIANPASFGSFTASVKRDDGVVVYVNGAEVYRSNLAGTVTYTTLAVLAGDDGNTPQTFSIPASAFIAGNNVVAVEIHQNAVTNTDISFDMELFGTPAATQTALSPYNSSWKFLANGSNQGTAWRANSFNDVSWPAGNAEFGYGDGGEATVVSFGSNAKKKYITTYFRKTINIPDVSAYTGYTLNLKRDDGAVVYINGVEVFRSNMPAGAISYTTKASASASDDGNIAQVQHLTAGQLVQGNNTIAVEIHQFNANDPDLSFDLQLVGTGGGGGTTASLTRGPYMNSAFQTGIVIRWRTNIATNSKVSFGTSAADLSQSVTDNTTTTEHVVTLTGLTPDTKYFYRIGSTTQVLQGDANNYFKTMPAPGSTAKIRFLVMGDMGNNSSNQVGVRNAWQNFNGTNHTDGFILLGDNAYSNGTDAEYQSNFYNVYQGNILKNHVLWPAPGNHDYANNLMRQQDHAIPYYSMFTLPTSGQAGGVASNNEAYYSYNYGNVHFVSLDSYGLETGSYRLYDTLGPQAVWLKQDLAANTQPWTVIYFHHPPYTKTSHNSDTENELINMRQKMVPIFERFEVDLVLSGHSHGYERSFLINGHYGLETTFSVGSHALSTSGAKYDGSANSCTYIKNAGEVRNGIVYAVVGSSGQLGGQTPGYPHNAMYYSNTAEGGAMYLEVENNKLLAQWVCADGAIRDNFMIMKNVNKTTDTTINTGELITLTASWIGSYNWSTSETTKSITVIPASTTSYTVTDGSGCITDVFNVTLNTGVTNALVGRGMGESNLKLYPTPLSRGQELIVETGMTKRTEFSLTDNFGRVLNRYNLKGHARIQTSQLAPGIYFLKWKDGKAVQVRKFVISN